MNLFLILMLVAIVCFGLAAAGVSARINLVALGLAFMALALALNAGLLV
jgi:hypothetical protein